MTATFNERLLRYLDGQAKKLYLSTQGTASEPDVYKALINILSEHPKYILEPFTEWIMERLESLHSAQKFCVPTDAETILNIYFALEHLDESLVRKHVLAPDFLPSAILDKCSTEIREAFKEAKSKAASEEDANTLLYRIKLENDKEIKEIISIMTEKVKQLEEAANETVQATVNTVASEGTAATEQPIITEAVTEAATEPVVTVATKEPVAEPAADATETVNTEVAVAEGEPATENESAAMVEQTVAQEEINIQEETPDDGQCDIPAVGDNSEGASGEAEDGSSGRTAEGPTDTDSNQGVVQETDNADAGQVNITEGEVTNGNEQLDGGTNIPATEGESAGDTEGSNAGDNIGSSLPGDNEEILQAGAGIVTGDTEQQTAEVTATDSYTVHPVDDPELIRNYILRVAKSAISEKLEGAFTSDLDAVLIDYAREEITALITETVRRVISRSVV